ncbi:receptor protein kinase-like protein At4g34220 [Prosopis cineraria]|uniref:receptor protein kinase-like protein At4g34220 n=1 Tax=Prosopis cineraria TaxID=364024 RepID=UPI00240FAD2E|nr:receptor protein kinase-like protein At4g34220 [Prosopis cineraria]
MNFNSKNSRLGCKVLFFHFLLLLRSFALNPDGVLLLSFKYSILSDPHSVLENWSYRDVSPCSWNGVTCTKIGGKFRVTSLALPESKLLGSISEDLGVIEHLRELDLSDNFLNGSVPNSIFNASELQVLSLANNVISGELSESIGQLKTLQLLNLSDNALAGSVPNSLVTLKNLTLVSLRSNYFSGRVPSGFHSVQILDLSSNLLNGSLPDDFGGDSLKYLNLSYNKISGTIPPEFSKNIPGNSTMDLSFNNLTGPIPQSLALLNQKPESLSGNSDLCGKPLKILCSIPSTPSNPPNATTSSTPAIAAIPKTIDANPETSGSATPNGSHNKPPNSLKPSSIAGIVVGDIAGIGLLVAIALLVYQQRKKKDAQPAENVIKTTSKQDPEIKKPTIPCFWLANDDKETSEATSSNSDQENSNAKIEMTTENENLRKEGRLVMMDGETRLELETLLTSSAYILGTSRGSIVYRAVLEDGRAYAVRRLGIGECAVEKMKDFENQVRTIVKIRHPNLVRVRGFCWGVDEKLLICDYVPNGSLANLCHRRTGSSPLSLSLEARLKIARGIARGVAFIHDKKHVHGNIKPSNILFNSDMEPVITDFGLDRLLCNSNNFNLKANSSSRQLASHTQQQQQKQVQDQLPPMASSSSGGIHPLPYQAPEWFQSIRPNPKCDVYSFGIVLLELLSGRSISDLDIGQWPWCDDVEEERNRVLRVADVAIRSEIENKERVILGCFKLGLSCASPVPQKRPSMKETQHMLEKMIRS